MTIELQNVVTADDGAPVFLAAACSFYDLTDGQSNDQIARAVLASPPETGSFVWFHGLKGDDLYRVEYVALALSDFEEVFPSSEIAVQATLASYRIGVRLCPTENSENAERVENGSG